MRDDGEMMVATVVSGDAVESGDADRRAAFRRKLPFGRGAVLKVGERAHIVGVADVSETGAFLSTRAPVSVGETHVLKLLILPERIEISIRSEVVRLAQATNESKHHPRGVGVRFVDLDAEARRRLKVYVAREPKRRPA